MAGIESKITPDAKFTIPDRQIIDHIKDDIVPVVNDSVHDASIALSGPELTFISVKNSGEVESVTKELPISRMGYEYLSLSEFLDNEGYGLGDIITFAYIGDTDNNIIDFNGTSIAAAPVTYATLIGSGFYYRKTDNKYYPIHFLRASGSGITVSFINGEGATELYEMTNINAIRAEAVYRFKVVTDY